MRIVWLLGLIAAALFVSIALYLQPLKPNVISLQFTFSESAFLAVLHGWQAEGVARFRAHFVADYALLVCYGAFGYTFARRARVFSSCPSGRKRLLTWALPLAALADAIENVLHLYLSSAASQAAAALFPAAGVAATFKWLLLGMFAAVAVLSLGKRTG